MGANAPSRQEQAMRKVGMTEEEIADVLKCDKAIDRGENLFPLDPSLEAGAKKARRADRTDTPKKANRERKEDAEKRKLILVLASAVGGDVHIVNPEREFEFTQAGRKFKVVLSCPRSQGAGLCSAQSHSRLGRI